MARQDRLDALLTRHGTSFAEEVGIDLRDPRPAELWSWYLACLLMSARISTDLAVRATRAYLDEIGRSVRATADATWKQRVDVLNANGYARYDERTSAMLGETSALVLDRYGGDLRKLREAADCDPAKERRLVKECKGIGDVGADIFFREVQAAWPELHPFADRRALSAAERLGLGSDADTLAGLVSGPGEFARLVAALVRVDLGDDHEAVLEAARSS